MNSSLWSRNSMLTPRSSNLGARKILTVPTFGPLVLFSTCNHWHRNIIFDSLLDIPRNGWLHICTFTYLNLINEICVLEVREACKHISSWGKVNTSGQINIILLPECVELILWCTRCLYVHRANSDSIVAKLQYHMFTSLTMT